MTRTRFATFRRAARRFAWPLALAAALWVVVPGALAQQRERSGKEVVEATCAACHRTGVHGAPKIGDRKAWAKRASLGLSSLTEHALNGIREMPAHGGNPGLTDREIARAVTYMVNQSGGHWTEPIDKARLPAERTGKAIVQLQCAKCHESGIGGAPKIADRAAWIPRVKQGLDTVVRSAINGHGGMPARGGMADLTDAEVRNAVVYMINGDMPVGKPPVAASAKGGPAYHVMGDTSLQLGVVSSRDISAHARDYPQKIAGSIPATPDQYYVTVAVFDANSGKRVDDALVKARVSTSSGAGPEKTLDPVTIANSPTYGGYFAMGGSGPYTISVRVERPGHASVRTDFEYEH